MARVITIMFEDQGQDFLEWDIDESNTVVASRPFQAGVWCGSVVLNERPLEIGDRLVLRLPHRVEPFHLRYEIEDIRHSEACR